MTSSAATRDEVRWQRSDEDGSGWLGRLRPEEGWLSILLVMILATSVAWSIADARWILGRDDLTGFLIWIAPLAVLWGWLSARLGMSRWLAHLLGAAIGAFVVIEAVGSLLPGAQPSLQGWFQATSDSVTQAYLDLTWRHMMSTPQYGHFCLVLGILVWGTSQAASYDVFGHRRAVNGVLLLAVALVANMSLTIHDQFAALVVFSGAALMLLLLAHAADEQTSWLRHRIWQARTFEMPHLRGGLFFAGIAVVGSLALTNVASSAPLADAWPGLNDNLRNFAVWVARYLPTNPSGTRFPTDPNFANNAPIGTTFIGDSTPVFQVRVPDVSDSFHWRLGAWDVYQSNGWGRSAALGSHQVDAGSEIDGGTLDLINAQTPGRKKVLLTVTVQNKALKLLVTPNEPSSVNVPTTVDLLGSQGGSYIAEVSTSAKDYQVTAYVMNVDFTGKGITQNKLRVAGTNYPPGLREQYTQGTEFIGSEGKALLNTIMETAAGAPFTNNYDKAAAIQRYLQSDGGFTYNTNITDVVQSQCRGLSTVDCFAKTKVGFCMQYATTMVMLLRMEGIPARFVQGYLPGSIDNKTLIRQVTLHDQHAWVEAYFPGYGWIEFDPTGGSVGVPTLLPKGDPIASPPPGASATAPAVGPRPTRRLNEPDGGTGGAGSTNDPGPGSMLLVVGGLVGIILVAIFVYLRRQPRRLDSPDVVYKSITRLAGWLGYRPRPTQTVYEYVGMLGSYLPATQEQLELVGRAKVEVTYGRRRLAPERLEALGVARSRIRRALLTLALRRPRLRRRSRRGTR